MRHGLIVLAILFTGCYGDGDRAPWNRPNTLLSHGQGTPAWLQEAAKDARGDNMQMQGDGKTNSNSSTSRSSKPLAFDAD